MTDYRAHLAAKIREALGQHNDDCEPVVTLVRKLVEERDTWHDFANAAVDALTYYENVLCCDQMRALQSGVTTMEVSLEKVADVLRERNALRKDAERLDYLDRRNAAKNKKHGTEYGWRLTENCNRIALEDHAWPPNSVRAAIDAAIEARRE